MAHVQDVADVSLDSPTLIEGLPGTGLVGKIAADHVVEQFGMEYVAAVHCDGLPEVAVYRGGSPDVVPPVRLYADGDRDLVVLQSDVPVSPRAATEFADCITGWIEANDVTPIYLSGLPVEEKSGVPTLSGVATGGAAGLLDEHGIDAPSEAGLVSGPTGALLYEANTRGIDSLGLVVETNPQFPDPESARVILTQGVIPITGIDLDTEDLLERAEEIQQAREDLAKRMQEAGEESSEATPLRMFQ